MGPGLTELQETLAAQGVKPCGPWFSHHLRMDPEVFDFEICLPVKKSVMASGRVKPGLLKAGRVVQTVYRGPYQGLAGAWREFSAWIAAGGHSVGPEFWESYVAGPELSSNPQDWQTELYRRLAP